MTPERYNLLMTNSKEELTPKELSEGWHFCLDWDGMLIHPSFVESQYCNCFKGAA